VVRSAHSYGLLLPPMRKPGPEGSVFFQSQIRNPKPKIEMAPQATSAVFPRFAASSHVVYGVDEAQI
jgi:hypothetical protein